MELNQIRFLKLSQSKYICDYMKFRTFKISLCIIISLCFTQIACTEENTNQEAGTTGNDITYTPNLSYNILKKTAHDPNAFIEGLLIHNGKIIESTGSPLDMPQTKSVIGILDTVKGKLNQKLEIDTKLFGEGIVILNSKLYQLTYQARKGFVYDATTFKKLSEFTIPTNEGWGMTTDGTSLIMSDGTDKLTFINPENFSVSKTIQVTNEYGGVNYLNELEYVNGNIYANVYMTNNIMKIDAANGKVLGKLDATNITNEVKSQYPSALEMNGIAYDQTRDVFLLTGKMWPLMYEIKIQ